MTKICAVTLMLISFSVSTMFAQQQPDSSKAQKPDYSTGQAPDYRAEVNTTAEILAAALEKIKRLEARQDELSKKLDNLQHRVDQLATKP
jgi:peptidoglycan hydrolase CwlO-like protein